MVPKSGGETRVVNIPPPAGRQAGQGGRRQTPAGGGQRGGGSTKPPVVGAFSCKYQRFQTACRPGRAPAVGAATRLVRDFLQFVLRCPERFAGNVRYRIWLCPVFRDSGSLNLDYPKSIVPYFLRKSNTMIDYVVFDVSLASFVRRITTYVFYYVIAPVGSSDLTSARLSHSRSFVSVFKIETSPAGGGRRAAGRARVDIGGGGSVDINSN
ncbi:hypothetical protein EVAR_68343_1 [Eumeta japonica]|uniref:Uncharacterized protein n=1 Tax=Eumeta variegata TaxID=151549 RepID=A0A4C1SJT4_EUMVA|nr:hypothetical protein EVAR_68343_1 [Eumeta japonica]